MLLRRLARVPAISVSVVTRSVDFFFTSEVTLASGPNFDVEVFLATSWLALPSPARKLAAELGRWLAADPGLELASDCLEEGLVLLRSATEREWVRSAIKLGFVATECRRALRSVAIVAAVTDFERLTGSTSMVSGYRPSETCSVAGEEDGGSKMLSLRTAFSSSSSSVIVKSAV